MNPEEKVEQRAISNVDFYHRYGNIQVGQQATQVADDFGGLLAKEGFLLGNFDFNDSILHQPIIKFDNPEDRILFN